MSYDAATKTYKLTSGHSMPVLGFGVYQVPPAEAERLVYLALKSGYRHIDSATYYANEEGSGAGIRKFMSETGTPRSEIFFTTKLANHDHGYEKTKAAIETSLAKSNISYIDLYLVHTPWPSSTKLRLGSWEAMEEAVKEGKLKSIGISNFGEHHLKELLAHCEIKPAVGQYELHPWYPKNELKKLADAHGIVLQAYSPITQGVRFEDPRLQKLVQKHGKSPAKVLIRWSIQKGYVPLVKSSSEGRMLENLDVWGFELSPEDMKLVEREENYSTTPGFDPTTKPLEGSGFLSSVKGAPYIEVTDY